MIRGFFRTFSVGLRYFCGIGAVQKHFKKKIPALEDMLSLKYDASGRTMCIGCRLCEKVCPAGALTLSVVSENGVFCLKKAEADAGRCVACGLCVEACPVDALIFQRHLPLSGGTRAALKTIKSAKAL